MQQALIWTTEAPAREGFYWFQQSGSTAKWVLNVYSVLGPTDLWVVQHELPSPVEKMAGRWAGPIHLPQEKEDELAADRSWQAAQSQLEERAFAAAQKRKEATEWATKPVPHPELVRALVKDPGALLGELTTLKVNLWHMATGAAGEAGELLDVVKKHAVYNKPLDLDHLIEEMGDLEFYLEGIRQHLNLDRNHILLQNVLKLQKRYAAGAFSNQAAQDRADKPAGQ